MYAVTAWMVQPLTCTLVGTYMETLNKNTKQKTKNNKEIKKSSTQFAEEKKETTPTSKYAELRRGRFKLHMPKMNQRNGIIPENYESELTKWQAVHAEFLKYKETRPAKARKSNFINTLVNYVNAQAEQGESRPFKTIIKDKLCIAIANDIDGFVRPVDKADWPMLESNLSQIFEQSRANKNFFVPQYECGQIFCGFFLIHCKNRSSKRTFANCVGKMRNKFEGKRLTVITAVQIPAILYNQSISKNFVAEMVQNAGTNNSGKADIQHSVHYNRPTPAELPKGRLLNSRPPLLPLPETGCTAAIEDYNLIINRAKIKRKERYKFAQRFLEQMQNVNSLTQSQRRRKRKSMQFIRKYEKLNFKQTKIIGPPQEQTNVYYDSSATTTNNEMREEDFSSDQEAMAKEVTYSPWNHRAPEEQTGDHHQPGLSSNEAEVLQMPVYNPFRSKLETSRHERRIGSANANRKGGFPRGRQSCSATQTTETLRNRERVMASWHNLNSEETARDYRSGFSSNNSRRIEPEVIRIPEFSHFRSNDDPLSMYDERQNESSNRTGKKRFREPETRETSMTTNDTSNRLWNSSDLNNLFHHGLQSHETELRQMQIYGDTEEQSLNERHSRHRFHMRSQSKDYGPPELDSFSQQNVGRLDNFNENTAAVTASTSRSTSHFANYHPAQDLRMENLDEERLNFRRREYPSTTTVQLKRKSEFITMSDHSEQSVEDDEDEIRSVSAREEARKEYFKAVDYLRKMEFCAKNSLSSVEKLRIEICQIRIENYKKRFGSQEREEEEEEEVAHYSRRNSYLNARAQPESSTGQQQAHHNYDTNDYSYNRAPCSRSSSAHADYPDIADEFNDPDLQIAIIDRNQKEGKISNEAWANIEYHLLQRLAQEVQETNNPNIGRFDSVYWQHGIKVIQCENLESKIFIERFIRHQDIYWPNTHYAVITARELPRRFVVKVWIPPPILEDLAILQIIKAQNSKFYSEDWTLSDSRVRRNQNGKDMYISISPNSLERLRRTDGEIRFGTNLLQMILPHEA